MRSAGQQLVQKLFEDPHAFEREGRAYDLLQCYFDGFPLETLRPLLRSDDAMVLKAAAFLAEELAIQAQDLIDDMIPLLSCMDRRTRYDILEAIAVCAEGRFVDRYVHVVDTLKSQDGAIRERAMELVSEAPREQLLAALASLRMRSVRQDIDERGLELLLSGENVEAARISRMLTDSDSLVRLYAAIAARRLARLYPELSDGANAVWAEMAEVPSTMNRC